MIPVTVTDDLNQFYQENIEYTEDKVECVLHIALESQVSMS